ncbi:COG4705 family protein [Pseudolysinimonas sp.]|uniref:COG4705 family protein n=1 Tax=Pseudolysinimonas sp. TaxID=2680009 RepID=UPI003F7E7AF7
MIRASDRLLRVPELTALFWVVKLLTTGVGETASDFLVKTLDPVPVVLAAAVVFVACFLVQFTARRYVPWRYWLFVSMVAVFGTMVADVTHIVIGVPYLVSTTAFAAALVVVFVLWRRVEGTISVHSITTGRRELFYWATVLATFALGTALGDLTATTFRLGYLGSGIVFAVLFAIPGVAYRLHLPATAAFWWAYVLTRPLGASFADWLAVDRARGGLALGTPVISGIGAVLIVVGIAWMQVRYRRSAPALRASVAES